ncbi:sarcosine oxidase subunit gamma [Neorhizobium sp. NPDC001467]|uniref:sarcosine oxidase subunit gamma n=1 Tax=Neorhizobium sp. NPDC001467 TaxID=3390595 RepID=UPI003D06FF92
MADLGIEAATRTLPLSGVHGGSSVVRLEPAAPAERISLRLAAADIVAMSAALGVDLPTKPKTSTCADGRTALWLGPDEWLVIADDMGEIGTGLTASAAKATVPHSATDVSHRNTAILVSGPGAATAINTGCPQDLSLNAFPVGACSRTIFGKVEIVLLRTAEDAFRVEVWRSFSDYAFGLLAEGARDAAF